MGRRNTEGCNEGGNFERKRSISFIFKFHHMNPLQAKFSLMITTFNITKRFQSCPDSPTNCPGPAPRLVQ